ncbi:NRDE family protein [Streptomyces desertarenae]|uniref:NRDE family protein n=1 Tax=Streptomyces desertarenae TaxID=2666184 RepID=A0ABW4PLR3_9ACTN
MCTVFFRLRHGERSPLLLGAVRDEFTDRAWKPPGRHWDAPHHGLVGGLDLAAGGTWLALDPNGPQVAVLVNGAEAAAPAPPGTRASRGLCPLRALTGTLPPRMPDLLAMGGFHLLVCGPADACLWSWNRRELTHRKVPPGDHVLTFHGLDDKGHDRAVGVLRALNDAPDIDPRPGAPPETAWKGWMELLGRGVPAERDPRSPLVDRTVSGRAHRSVSASLIALSTRHVRFDFTADPWNNEGWYEI